MQTVSWLFTWFALMYFLFTIIVPCFSIRKKLMKDVSAWEFSRGPQFVLIMLGHFRHQIGWKKLVCYCWRLKMDALHILYLRLCFPDSLSVKVDNAKSLQVLLHSNVESLSISFCFSHAVDVHDITSANVAQLELRIHYLEMAFNQVCLDS